MNTILFAQFFFYRNVCCRSFGRIFDEKSSPAVSKPKHKFILVEIGLFGAFDAVVEHCYVYALNVITGYLVRFYFFFCVLDFSLSYERQVFS